MKLLISILITVSCLMLSQYRLVSDATDYALYHDYYPALKLHQYKFAEAECRGSETKLRYLIAMMLTESEFKERAVSSAGAIGLGQIMPFHVNGDPSILYDPHINIMYASKILDRYMVQAGGDILMALKNYNAGPNRNPHKYRGWISYVYKIHVNAREAI